MSKLTDVIVKDFLPFLSNKTGVDLPLLVATWEEFNGVKVKAQNGKSKLDSIQKPTEQAPMTYTSGVLEKMTIKDLKVVCENLHLTKVGLKQQLIQRILEASEPCPSQVDEQVAGPDLEVQPEAVPEAVPEPVAKKPIKSVKKSSKTPADRSHLKLDFSKLRGPDVTIEKNENGNWINKETGIVFTSDEEYDEGIRCRLAIGFEDEDGYVENLTDEKIELCNQYGFRYRD